MKKTTRIAAHLITVICILAAGGVLFHIISTCWNFGFAGVVGQGTRIEFKPNIQDNSFNKEMEIYTGDDITSVFFSGKITVDGTANISIISNDDGSTAYSKLYTAVKEEKIQFDVSNLAPDSYYTLIFSSTHAKKAYLILTTNHSLREPPKRPEPPYTI